MIYWDLDGVLRALPEHVLGYEPTHWNSLRDGKNVIELVNENPGLCLSAPETEYLPIVNNNLSKIHLMTSQLPGWIPYTNKWLDDHIKIPYEVIYTTSSVEKLSLLGDNLLVEDFPNFPSYDRIALITRKYNEHLDVPLRISSVEQFKVFLDKHVNR